MAQHKLDASKTYLVAELKKLTGSPPTQKKRSSGSAEGPYHNTLRFVASPAVAPGLIIVPSAKRGPVQALRPTLSGDATGKDGSMVWQMARGTPDVPSPLIHDGLVYLCSEMGILTVVDAKTGENVYTERLHNQRHRSSPVYADGHVYMCARDGVISVVKAGREFELVSQNKMDETLTASLVISHGTIYVRTFDALYAIR